MNTILPGGFRRRGWTFAPGEGFFRGMRAWPYLALALAVGGLAALVALLAVSPPAAFAAGALLVALAAALIGPRRAGGACARAARDRAAGGMPHGVRPGADREAADAAPRHLAHRADRLCQPRRA